MSEQAIIAQQPVSAPAPQPEPAPANGDRQRRPNRGMQRELRRQNAATRLPELLTKISALKCELRASDAEVDRLRVKVERLRCELLAAREANDDFRRREEQRLFDAEEQRKAMLGAADEKRLLCFRALIDIADQTGSRKRHVDWDSRVKRAEKYFSTELLAQILVLRNVNVIGELVYLLACNEKAAQQLAALPLLEAAQQLARLVSQIEEQFKTVRLKESLGG